MSGPGDPVRSRCDDDAARFRSLVENAPMVAYSAPIAADAGEWYASPQIERLLGFDAREWTADLSLWQRQVHPDDRERVLAAEAKLRAGECDFTEVYRYYASDGRIVWVQDQATVVRDEQGRPLSYQGVMVDITPLQQAREAQRLSEERLRTILRTTQEGFVLLAQDGRFLYVNDAYARMTGYQPDELVALSIAGLDLAYDPEVVAGRMQEIAETGGAMFEVRHRRKDGGVFDAYIAVQSMREGDRVLLFAFIRDVTELRRAGEALLRSERRYRQLVEDAPVAIYSRDLTDDSVPPYISPVIERILGWPRSCWSDHSFFKKVLHPDDRERVIAESDHTKLTGEDFVDEFRFLATDGRPHWFYDHATVIRDAGGRPLMMQGVMVEITERKEAEEALHASERRFREVLDSLQMLAVLLDAEGHIQYANPFLLSLTGWQWEEVAGKDWFDLFLSRADAVTMRGEVLEATVSDSHSGAPVEHEIVARDGQRRLVRWSNTVLRDAAATPIGTASIGEDVTEKRRLEERLHQAQKMETVGRLAGGIAHDFNNLLTTITGYGEFVQEGLLPGSAAYHDIGEVLRAADRASDLTRQLLAFSRRQVIRPKMVDVNELVADMEETLRRLLGTGIDLVLQPQPSLWSAKVDPGQIEQVLVNLALNARDAMPNGGALTIETANTPVDLALAMSFVDVEPGDYVCLTVSDTGVGMSDAVQTHLFEPFFTTKEAGQGAGLGLSTAYGIVKQHGGHITAQSTPGVGSRFRIYLPKAAGEAVPSLAGTDRQPLQTGDEAVLVVEDDASVRRVMARVLTGAGYRVLEAATPAEAFALVKENPQVDLLLADVVMPQMSGKALADRLREERADLKVLFVSGYPQDQIGNGAVPGIGLAFLHKPFTAAALAAKVRALLDGVPR